MPWPFRRHRSDGAAAPAPAASSGRPVTIDDLAGHRRLVAHAGGWQKIEPLRPSATGAAAPVVSSSASFISHLAGTQPLLPTASLREVSSDAPRGVTRGLARSLPDAPFAPPPPLARGTEPVTAEQFGPPESLRRPVVVSGTPNRPDLTTFVGDLVLAEPEPEPHTFVEPDVLDDEIREELPPPIFSTLLAERTGRELSELRPDLVATEGDDETLVEDFDVAQPARRRSLAESRRLGLGAPLPSGPFDVGNRVRVDDEPVDVEAPVPEPVRVEEMPVPQPPVQSEPARRAVAHYRRAEVPHEVRTDVTRALGRDPGAVPIRREREVSDIASRIGARAFTREGEVFLPVEAGPLDSPETRAVLAHELTHVVQQRLYGSSLPRPSSAEGQRLEAEAHAIERFVRGDDPEPVVAPIRTLRATPGDPRVDSGGFTRAVTEQLVARGAAEWDADGALVFQPPQGSSDEWRAPADATGNEAFRNALRDDQRATTDYARGRTGPVADLDRAENDRHLRFVHDWQGQIRDSGRPAAEDARLSLAYQQSRGGSPDAAVDSHEFDRHLQHVNQSQGGEEEEEIVLVSGGLGTALGMTMGIRESYDRTQEMIAVDRERQRQAKLLEDMRKAQAVPGQSTTNAGQAAPGTTATTPATPSAPAAPIPPTTPTSGTTPAPSAGPRGGTEAHWEDDEDIVLVNPDKQEAGVGAALGLLTVFSHHDEDLSRDSHFGQHLVPAQPATTSTAATPATPVTPAAGAVPAVQAHEMPAVAGVAAAVAGGAQSAATHHDLMAAGTRPRERSIDGTDPTDVIAHLDDQDLEDLASLLFDRLQTRLRRDLIVDRERSGFLTDFR
jgi:Domain of unknown function (DUF4157)